MLQKPVQHRLASLAKYDTPIWLSKGNNRSKRMRILRLKGQLSQYPLLDYASFCRNAHTVQEKDIPISEKKLRKITVSPDYFRKSINCYTSLCQVFMILDVLLNKDGFIQQQFCAIQQENDEQSQCLSLVSKSLIRYSSPAHEYFRWTGLNTQRLKFSSGKSKRT